MVQNHSLHIIIPKRAFFKSEIEKEYYSLVIYG